MAGQQSRRYSLNLMQFALAADMGSCNAGAQHKRLPPFPYSPPRFAILKRSRSDNGSLSAGPALRAVFGSR